jgi:hypothetical protein
MLLSSSRVPLHRYGWLFDDEFGAAASASSARTSSTSAAEGRRTPPHPTMKKDRSLSTEIIFLSNNHLISVFRGC